MAEVQTNTQSGELAQRFIEFVMMQAQNAALFLGQIPNPQSGEGEVNLELAKMFIDQLSMIQEKTRGNLTTEESTVLRNTLTNLQMAFVEVSQNKSIGAASSPPTSAPPAGSVSAFEPSSVDSSVPQEPPVPGAPPAASPSTAEGESRKKFTKSYGS